MADARSPIDAIIDYTNWRGERSKRRIVPVSIRFGKTDWHPEHQWLLLAWDMAKQEPREFAMKDIHSWVSSSGGDTSE
jgi:hypothetical protein